MFYNDEAERTLLVGFCCCCCCFLPSSLGGFG